MPEETIQTPVTPGNVTSPVEKSTLEQPDEEIISDEQMRRIEAESQFRAAFASAIQGLYEQSKLTDREEDVLTRSSLISSSHLQNNYREERASKIVSAAYARIPYLRRHFCPSLARQLFVDGNVFVRDETTGILSVVDSITDHPGLALLLELLPNLPERDLMLPICEKDAEKDLKEKDKDKKEKDKKKKTSTSSDTKEKNEDKRKAIPPPPTLRECFERSNWALEFFISTLCIILSHDAIKSKHRDNVSSDATMVCADLSSQTLRSALLSLRPEAKRICAETSPSPAADLVLSRAFYWMMIGSETLNEPVGSDMDGFLVEMTNVYRLAAIKKLTLTQATVLNVVLRQVIESKDWTRALSIVTKSTFPTEAHRSTAHPRYLYYKGLVTAMCQANTKGYEIANNLLSLAYRKSPSGPRGSGLRLHIVRVLVTTDLVLGKPVNRSVLTDEDLIPNLKIYRDLAKAVHLGGVSECQRLLKVHEKELVTHASYPLMSRHLVGAAVRASLIRITRTYQRIPMEDVRTKIGMKAVDIGETYSIVERAIAERILMGVMIDHDAGHLVVMSSSRDDKLSTRTIMAELERKRHEITTLQTELRESLCSPNKDELDDEARLQVAERARKEAEETALRAQDAYYEEDFDF